MPRLPTTAFPFLTLLLLSFLARPTHGQSSLIFLDTTVPSSPFAVTTSTASGSTYMPDSNPYLTASSNVTVNFTLFPIAGSSSSVVFYPPSSVSLLPVGPNALACTPMNSTSTPGNLSLSTTTGSCNYNVSYAMNTAGLMLISYPQCRLRSCQHHYRPHLRPQYFLHRQPPPSSAECCDDDGVRRHHSRDLCQPLESDFLACSLQHRHAGDDELHRQLGRHRLDDVHSCRPCGGDSEHDQHIFSLVCAVHEHDGVVGDPVVLCAPLLVHRAVAGQHYGLSECLHSVNHWMAW